MSYIDRYSEDRIKERESQNDSIRSFSYSYYRISKANDDDYVSNWEIFPEIPSFDFEKWVERKQ